MVDTGERPDQSGAFGAWKVIGTCGNTTPKAIGYGESDSNASTNGNTRANSYSKPDGNARGSAWAAGVAYTAGDKVSYSGKTYICLQSHTSLQGWEPHGNAGSMGADLALYSI